MINRYKMGKHLAYQMTDTSLTIERETDQIAAEAALDGIYVLRTSLPATELDAPATAADRGTARPGPAGVVHRLVTGPSWTKRAGAEPAV